VTGLLLLERLGTGGTLRLLLALGGLAFLLVRARRSGVRRGLLLRAVALGLALLALPSTEALWKRLHGVTAAEPPSFIGEDASAVSVVVPGEDTRWRVAVNGMPHSWLPFEGIHTLLGAVPALLHAAPVEVAVIGLGSGETAWAASCRSETRSVRIFEIAAAQPRLLEAVSRAAFLPDLRRLLADPRVRMEAADGRQALLRSPQMYDVIQVDAVFLTSAGSGNLYSEEFFRLCASRLKPGGLVCTQKPSRRVGLTFAEALPHALDFRNMIVGSNEPLPVDLPAWEARLDAPAVASYFGREVAEGIRERFHEARPARRNPDTRLGLNRDLFPRDEFGTPARR
jgi:spermidine synthase